VIRQLPLIVACGVPVVVGVVVVAERVLLLWWWLVFEVVQVWDVLALELVWLWFSYVIGEGRSRLVPH